MASLNVQAAEPHIVLRRTKISAASNLVRRALPPGYVIEIDWSDFSSAQGIMGKAK